MRWMPVFFEIIRWCTPMSRSSSTTDWSNAWMLAGTPSSRHQYASRLFVSSI
jgi:hypothetical protein